MYVSYKYFEMHNKEELSSAFKVAVLFVPFTRANSPTICFKILILATQ